MAEQLLQSDRDVTLWQTLSTWDRVGWGSVKQHFLRNAAPYLTIVQYRGV